MARKKTELKLGTVTYGTKTQTEALVEALSFHFEYVKPIENEEKTA